MVRNSQSPERLASPNSGEVQGSPELRDRDHAVCICFVLICWVSGSAPCGSAGSVALCVDLLRVDLLGRWICCVDLLRVDLLGPWLCVWICSAWICWVGGSAAWICSVSICWVRGSMCGSAPRGSAGSVDLLRGSAPCGSAPCGSARSVDLLGPWLCV